MATETNSVVR